MIGLIMLAAGTVLPALSGEARSDLTCFEATSWAISTIASEDTTKMAARTNLEALRVFFLGRLSGRDDLTNWITAARQEMQQTAKTPSYAAVIEPCSQTFLRKAKGE